MVGERCIWLACLLGKGSGGQIARRANLKDRVPAKSALIEQWLDGAAQPLARVLDRLAPQERAAFVKAMDMLEAELRVQDAGH